MKYFLHKVQLHVSALDNGHLQVVQGDSLARCPKLLSIKNYVNQLTDDELTTGYYQQDGATCHTSIESFFFKTELCQKNLWPPRSPDLTPADCFLWGPIEWAKCTKIHPAQWNNSKTLYAKRFKPSTSTLWEKYSRIWRNAFKCAWM